MALDELEVVPVEALPPDDPNYMACGREDSHAAAAEYLAYGAAPDEPDEPRTLEPRGSTYERATWLVPQLQRWCGPAGVPIKLVAGWETRERPPTSGSFYPRAPLIHHTASKGTDANPAVSLGTCVNGRPDLSGPLVQALAAYDGSIYVISIGRCNHAGVAKATGPMPAGDGNALFAGLEVQSDGYQVMPAAQRLAVVMYACAVLEHTGHAADYVRRHYDSSVTGKWDIGEAGKPLSLGTLQADVAAALAAGPTPQKDEDDMWIRKRKSNQTEGHTDCATPLVNGEWTTLAIGEKAATKYFSLLVTDKDGIDVAASAAVTVDGLPEGTQVQLRFVEVDDKDAVTKGSYIDERLATQGTTFAALDYSTGHVDGGGHKLRVQAKVFADNGVGKITIWSERHEIYQAAV